MLLDIFEPGQTPLPHEGESVAVGIDLGTTHSVVAIGNGETVEILADAQGRKLLPSVAAYSGNGRWTVGDEAYAQLRAGKRDVVASIKRLMGRSAADLATVGDALPFRLSPRTEGMVRIVLGGQEFTPVEISAEILKSLKQRAEQALGKEVAKAVITVPAYFDEAARAATKDAARLAGLDVLRLIAEPTAAALAYGLDNGAEGLYAVYDLGGGTFDFSVLKMEMGVFQVLATGGDTQLGGDDFDRTIAERLLKLYEEKTGNALCPEPSALGQLLTQARAIKEKLSDRDMVEGAVTIGGQHILYHISRGDLEGWIEPIARRTLAIVQDVLADAEIAAGDIQGVVLVGGSTRVPFISRLVAEYFRKEPLSNVNPDEVVAVGAAVQAHGLTQGMNALLLDVTPLSLGLETMGGIVEKLIWRNSPIPVAVSQEFTTYQDGQTGMVIHALQGEREMVDQCRSLARFELSGIPPLPAGVARIKVTFELDADGLLTVSAREEITGTEQRIAVKPSYGLSVEEIEHMLVASMENAKDDMQTRLLAEAKTEAERTYLATQGALERDGGLLNDTERYEVNQALGVLKERLQQTDRDAIIAAHENLERSIQIFAERRMNQHIKDALAGHTLGEVENALTPTTHQEG